MSLEAAKKGVGPAIETDSSWIVAVVRLRLMKFESVVPITWTIPNEGVTDAEPHVKTSSAATRLPAEMLQTPSMPGTIETMVIEIFYGTLLYIFIKNVKSLN
jgi:hypothetical protein